MATWKTLRDAGLAIMLIAIFEEEHIHSLANVIAFYIGGAAYIIGAARARK